MPRKWLQQAIEDEYLPAIKALEDTPAGRQQAEALNRAIRQAWRDRGSKDLTQQQGLMDGTRRTLKDRLGEDHWILNYICFSSEEYTELNDIKQGRVAQRNEATQQLDNIDAIVALGVKLLKAADWPSIAAGLAVTTGRRIAELLSTAQFEKKTQWSVVFTGALKRRDETQPLAFEIPTLTTADRVIDALSRLRAELPQATQMTPAQINSKYESAVAKICDQAFADLVPARPGKENLYSHLFRAIYATIATFWYCPPTVDQTEFRAAIQGHYALLDQQNPELRRSIAAGRHYSDYEISDKEIANYNGKRKGIKLGVGGIQPIEQFKEAMKPKAPLERHNRTSIRVWHSDKVRLNRILQRFEGTQLQRFNAFLNWLEALDPSPEIEATTLQDPMPATDAPAIEETEVQSEATLTEPEVTDSSAAPTPLEGKIERLVEVMEKFVQWQMASAQSDKPTKTTRTITPAQPTADRAMDETETIGKTGKPASNEAPRQRARATETIDRINRALDKIIAYNNAPERKHSEKWAIGINTLKAFVGSQEAIVAVIGGRNRKGEAVEGTRQKEIQQHHQKHQIDADKHNYTHRGKTKIEDVIQI